MTISTEYRARLVIMVKAPVAGRVKTRLGRDIGMTAAAWWFRHQADRTVRKLSDPRWETVLAVSPDGARLPVTSLPRMDQGRGDLGTRMARILRWMPPGPVAIVGADIPGMEKTHVARAFTALGSHEAVFGPATDGGFWLVGMKRVRAQPTGLFQGVRWSTCHALGDSIETLGGWRISLVDEMSDVDRGVDLRALKPAKSAM